MPRSTASPRSRRRLSLAAALGAAVAGPMPIVLAGVLAVQLERDLSIGEGALGAAVSVYLLVGALLSPGAGRVTDRKGWSWTIRASALTSAVSLLVLPAIATGYAWFLAPFLIGAAGHALATPAGNLALAQEMPPGRMALTFGMKHTANPIAGLFAGASVPLLALTVGWRWAFVAAAWFPLATWLLARRVSSPGATRPEPQRSEPGPTARWRRPPRNPDRGALVALALGGGFGGLGVSVLSTFTVLTAVRAGVPEGTAGLYIALCSAVGLVVRVLAGWLADRHDSTGIRPVGLMLAIGSVGYVLMATGREAVILPAMLLAYSAGWGWPGLFQYGISRHHAEEVGAASGAIQVGVLLGAAIGPLWFGFVAAGPGYAVAWSALAALTFIGGGVNLYAASRLDQRTRLGTSADGSAEPLAGKSVPGC